MADKLVTQVSQDADQKVQGNIKKVQPAAQPAPKPAAKPAPKAKKWSFCGCMSDADQDVTSSVPVVRPSFNAPNNPNGNANANADAKQENVEQKKKAADDSPKQASLEVKPNPKPYPSNALLPPQAQEHKGRKTLVLDLDETLVHSSFKPVPDPDILIEIELDGEHHQVYVLKRPGVDDFLKAVGEKFEVVVFTASLSKYANPLLDKLDIHKAVHYRLFREHCVQHYGNFVKDLSRLGRELYHSMIVDNSPYSYIFQPELAIPITSWFSEKSDGELMLLMPMLEQCTQVDDVRQVLSQYYVVER